MILIYLENMMLFQNIDPALHLCVDGRVAIRWNNDKILILILRMLAQGGLWNNAYKKEMYVSPPLALFSAC